MELIANSNVKEMIQESNSVIQNSSSNFIEANTKQVSLTHLKNDCIIPVFAKDNEITISHYEFIKATMQVAKEYYDVTNLNVSIRVSHQIKGRVPSAIGKPVKELLEHEKTVYYERMAFMIEIPSYQMVVNNQILNLCIGGVRAYNQENLFSKKSIEKFKVFIGFKNSVCTNLCISTDGLKSEVRVSGIAELKVGMQNLITSYTQEQHLESMEKLSDNSLSEKQFAHLIGKMRMYHFLSKEEKKGKFHLQLTDSQIGAIVKDYFNDDNFKRQDNKINLWKIYNLFTGANKSSYIDSNLERNVNAFEFIQNLSNSIEKKIPNWYLTH